MSERANFWALVVVAYAVCGLFVYAAGVLLPQLMLEALETYVAARSR